MKTLILCAGYATRLYPLTLNQPKHLLPIGGRPMLEYAIDKINEIQEIDKIYIVTNNKFYNVFIEWVQKIEKNIKKPIEVFNDMSLSDDTKLGAIGDMQFVIDKTNLNDDLIVIAGDNLFQLDLKKFIDFGKEKGLSIAVRDVGDIELMKKYGEVILDTNKKLISFVEKPKEPKTTLAAICMYFFPKNKLYLIKQYISEGRNTDQPGLYIQWLHKIENVYGFVFTEKWYDIGDIKQYKEADKDYTYHQNNEHLKS